MARKTFAEIQVKPGLSGTIPIPLPPLANAAAIRKAGIGPFRPRLPSEMQMFHRLIFHHGGILGRSACRVRGIHCKEPRRLEIVIDIILPVFGVAAMGYLVTRIGWFDSAAERGLAKFVFDFAIPLMLFRSLATADLPSEIPWGYFISYYAGAGSLYGLGIVIAKVVFKRDLGGGIITAVCTLGMCPAGVMCGFAGFLLVPIGIFEILSGVMIMTNNPNALKIQRYVSIVQKVAILFGGLGSLIASFVVDGMVNDPESLAFLEAHQ